MEAAGSRVAQTSLRQLAEYEAASWGLSKSASSIPNVQSGHIPSDDLLHALAAPELDMEQHLLPTDAPEQAPDAVSVSRPVAHSDAGCQHGVQCGAADGRVGPVKSLYKASTLPFQAPPFDRIKNSDYQHAIDAGIRPRGHHLSEAHTAGLDAEWSALPRSA
jgi:hypothetical protein